MIKRDPFKQKTAVLKDDDLVCYCFQYTKKQIENDYIDNGKSLILKKIALEKKNGGCDCAVKNPAGS